MPPAPAQPISVPGLPGAADSLLRLTHSQLCDALQDLQLLVRLPAVRAGLTAGSPKVLGVGSFFGLLPARSLWKRPDTVRKPRHKCPDICLHWLQSVELYRQLIRRPQSAATLAS